MKGKRKRYKQIAAKETVERYKFEYVPLTQVKEYVEELIEQYGPDATLEFYVSGDNYWGTSLDIEICFTRTETEEERAKRLARNKQERERRNIARAREAKEEEELYEKLKAKFEK